MTSGEVARPTQAKSALKTRKVDFLELLKEQVNVAEVVLFLIVIHKTLTFYKVV